MKILDGQKVLSIIMVVIIVILAYINLTYETPVHIPTNDELCIQEFGYYACKAARVCGSMSNVSRVTTGGFFGIGEGYECKQ